MRISDSVIDSQPPCSIGETNGNPYNINRIMYESDMRLLWGTVRAVGEVFLDDVNFERVAC